MQLGDLFIAIPWFIHILPIMGIGLLFIATERKFPFEAVALVLFFALPFFIHPETPLSTKSVSVSGQTEFSVCSVNTYHNFNSVERSDALKKISAQNCDIYFLQEIWQAHALVHYLEPELQEILPQYYFAFDGEFVVASRFPIKNTELGSHEGYLAANIDIGSSEVTFVNIHFWNPLTPRGCQSFKKQVYTENCLLASSYIRNQQLNEFESLLRRSNNSVIFAGDFNSTLQMSTMQRLRTMSQHIMPSTFGLNATFPSQFPLIQIDHIFIFNKKSIKVSPSETFCNTEVSDHCLIKATFQQ
jgi:endonuclease/exonuclease/phosphatase (EEP) superfamily protein YafD